MPRGTILVVDDSLDIRGFVGKLLETAGYTVVTAADGSEGLRLYEKHQSSIELLLTDVMMPNMDGLELADRVLEIDAKLPVLLMSGDSRTACRGLECVGKPFRPAELVERVSRVLSANSPYERTASAGSPG